MDINLDIEKFTELVIEKWQLKISSLGITDTHELFNSFQADIIRDANGNPEIIKFIFNYYGRFLDMGVFGTGSRKIKTAVRHTRKKQPWYSATFARQVRRLADLMARKYGYQSVVTITEAIKK